MIEKIKGYIRDYRVAEAFRAAAEGVESDHEKQQLLLSILSMNNNVAILYLDDLGDKIKEEADKGNPYMQLAWARIHDALSIDPNSAYIKEIYFKKALQAGIGDACFYLAKMYLEGDLGERDEKRARELIEKGVEMESVLAVTVDIRDKIFGSEVSVPDPEWAYEMIMGYISKVRYVYPVFYLLLGHAATQAGRKDDAVRAFRLAAENGCAAGFMWWAMTECTNEDVTVVNKERYMEIMERGMEVRAAECYVMCSMMIDDYVFDQLTKEEQQSFHSTMRADLETGWTLGNSSCALFLGIYYEQGAFGFEKNYAEAWKWYARGALLHCALSYAAMARMVLTDKTAPEGYTEDIGCEIAYRSLLLDNLTILPVVIEGYMKGYLTAHANMIERKWLPEYERMNQSDRDSDL